MPNGAGSGDSAISCNDSKGNHFMKFMTFSITTQYSIMQRQKRQDNHEIKDGTP
jgi:hypothetical protein